MRVVLLLQPVQEGESEIEIGQDSQFRTSRGDRYGIDTAARLGSYHTHTHSLQASTMSGIYNAIRPLLPQSSLLAGVVALIGFIAGSVIVNVVLQLVGVPVVAFDTLLCAYLS